VLVLQCVVNILQIVALSGKEFVVLGVLNVELLLDVGGGTLGQLVEDVERTLSSLLAQNTRLFEQVGADACAGDRTSLVELDLNELTETRTVVVTESLCVGERFQNRVGLDDLSLEQALSAVGSTTGDGSEVLDDLLGVLGLSGTGLSSDQNRLILSLLQQVAVGVISDGENVRGDLLTTLATVVVDDLRQVDRVQLVRVDHDVEQTRIRINNLTVVTAPQVVEDRGFTQTRKGSAIGHTVELGRVHLLEQSGLALVGLTRRKLGDGLGALGLENLTSLVLILADGNPDELLVIESALAEQEGVTRLVNQKVRQDLADLHFAHVCKVEKRSSLKKERKETIEKME